MKRKQRQRLFTNDRSWTPAAQRIANRLRALISDDVERWAERYDLHDLHYVLTGVVGGQVVIASLLSKPAINMKKRKR